MTEIEKVQLKSDIYKIADFYSEKTRLVKMMEECGELTQAAAKCITESDDIYISKAEKNHLAGEIADVLIMAEQIMYLFCLHDTVSDWVDKKVERQLERMADETEEEND